MIRTMIRLHTALVGMILAASVGAQTWPSKPITMVVPSASGGLSDGFVRMIGDGLQATWGQPVIMVHRPGAGGIVGTEFVAKSAPDGYTLLMGNIGPLAINPTLYGKVPYNVEKDFAAVSLVATYPNVLVVNPSVPVNSVAALIALAKEKPGTLHFASAGVGQSHHLSGEVFKRMVGIDIVHVPYKGTGPALTDLLGGQVQMMFSNVPPAVQLIKAGRLRPLGVTSAKRNVSLPDVPSISEAGVPGFDLISWLGIVAPAATPREVITRLNAEIAKATNTAGAREKYSAQGAEPGTSLSVEQFDAFLKAEGNKWDKIIRDANIKAE